MAVLLPAARSWERDLGAQVRRLAATLSGFVDALIVLGQPLPAASTLAHIPHNIDWRGDVAAALNEAAALVAIERPSAKWLFIVRADEELIITGNVAALVAQLEASNSSMALCTDTRMEIARVGGTERREWRCVVCKFFLFCY